MSTDEQLGIKISTRLQQLGIETPMVNMLYYNDTNGGQSQLIRSAHATIMNSLGLDLQDDSLKDTPSRIAKMYTQEVFYGLDYTNFPKCTTIENKMGYDEVVVVKGIDVLSMCEHHFVPFIGCAHVGYIPKTKVLGLSKFNRVVDFFSRRPQVQERLGEQIHLALRTILETDDIAIVIEAQHFCVKLRGVKQDNTSTVTSKVTGRFMEKPELRAEFMALIR